MCVRQHALWRTASFPHSSSELQPDPTTQTWKRAFFKKKLSISEGFFFLIKTFAPTVRRRPFRKPKRFADRTLARFVGVNVSADLYEFRWSRGRQKASVLSCLQHTTGRKARTLRGVRTRFIIGHTHGLWTLSDDIESGSRTTAFNVYICRIRFHNRKRIAFCFGPRRFLFGLWRAKRWTRSCRRRLASGAGGRSLEDEARLIGPV